MVALDLACFTDPVITSQSPGGILAMQKTLSMGTKRVRKVKRGRRHSILSERNKLNFMS